MSAFYLYEFLYRSWALGAGKSDAYHVILAQDVAMPGQDHPHTVVGPPMTPEQAEAAGYPLPDLLSAINGAAMAERDALRQQLAAVTAERDALRAAASSGEASEANPNP